MKKIILILITLVIFVGCDRTKETINTTEKYLLPEELKDCKVFWMQAEGGGTIKVVRCPNSNTTTSYQNGKTQKDISVIEEELNQAKIKESALNKLTEEEKKALGLVQ